ncbi:MAG TPA: hypothetical protein VM032_04060 [Vicinamibacterales bacterium]|nr:hypothetical protein [Vicinamibacterales bacterium]
MKRTPVALMFAALLTSVPCARAQATQTPRVDPQHGAAGQSRWSAWLGCWTPSARSADADTLVCFVPDADGRGVRMLTFAGDREIAVESVVADGSPHPATEKGCTGERTSRWAAAGPRLFSSSTLICEGQPAITTSGISALLPADRWVDVQVATTGGREQVRTRRFWRSSAAPPAAVADVLRGLQPARAAAAALNADDVIEASRAVSATGVEAWLAESGARVPIDRRALLRLADAQVGSNVIDLLVALAFPGKFEVRRAASSGGGGFSGGSIIDGDFPGEWGYLADVYGLGFGSFGVPYYGANGYFAFQPGGYYYLPPAVGSGGGVDTEHGRAVNGQGYTRVQPREAYRGTASTQSGGGAQSAADSGSGGGSSSGGSSGASPSGYSGGGGSSTGLSAVPR